MHGNDMSSWLTRGDRERPHINLLLALPVFRVSWRLRGWWSAVAGWMNNPIAALSIMHGRREDAIAMQRPCTRNRPLYARKEASRTERALVCLYDNVTAE